MTSNEKDSNSIRHWWKLISLLLIIIIIAGMSFLGKESLKMWIELLLVNIILIVSLYIFSGNSGVISFGHVSFWAVGAYVSGLITMSPERKVLMNPNIYPFLIDIRVPDLIAPIIGGLAAAIFGLLFALIMMRLSSLAASISTFALMIIVHSVISHWTQVTGGAAAISIPMTTNLINALTWTVIVIICAFFYQESKYGLKLRAARENQIAASSIGINVIHQRITAFSLSAFFSGLGGALYGHFLGILQPTVFTLSVGFMPVAMLIIGGVNSLSGAVLGPIAVSVIDEVLRQTEAGINIGLMSIQAPVGLREVGLALLMLLILIYRPNGISNGKEINWPFNKLHRKGLETKK